MELNLDWQRCTSAVWPEVGYELRPLRVWAFQELLAFWEAQAPPPSAEATPTDAAPDAARPRPGAPTLAATARLMDVARRIFPEHVRGLSGLQVRGEAGTALVAVADLCEETALLPLAAEIVARLIGISTLDEGAEKTEAGGPPLGAGPAGADRAAGAGPPAPPLAAALPAQPPSRRRWLAAPGLAGRRTPAGAVLAAGAGPARHRGRAGRRRGRPPPRGSVSV